MNTIEYSAFWVSRRGLLPVTRDAQPQARRESDPSHR